MIQQKSEEVKIQFDSLQILLSIGWLSGIFFGGFSQRHFQIIRVSVSRWMSSIIQSLLGQTMWVNPLQRRRWISNSIELQQKLSDSSQLFRVLHRISTLAQLRSSCESELCPPPPWQIDGRLTCNLYSQSRSATFLFCVCRPLTNSSLLASINNGTTPSLFIYTEYTKQRAIHRY